MEEGRGRKKRAVSARADPHLFSLSLSSPSQVYNYWEPLHYLLFGAGMQTWEYSSAFALRPFIYLLLHALPAAPAAALAGRAAAFYAVRAVLATASAASEAALIAALGDVCGRPAAVAALALAAPLAGLFAAAPALLPSSFAMVALTAASAALLRGRTGAVIWWASVGVVWGWVVAGAAFVPAALAVLAAPRLPRSVGLAVAALAATLGPLVAVDRVLYGRWTVRMGHRTREERGSRRAQRATHPPPSTLSRSRCSTSFDTTWPAAATRRCTVWSRGAIICSTLF